MRIGQGWTMTLKIWFVDVVRVLQQQNSLSKHHCIRGPQLQSHGNVFTSTMPDHIWEDFSLLSWMHIQNIQMSFQYPA
jgi:hypothetical protein